MNEGMTRGEIFYYLWINLRPFLVLIGIAFLLYLRVLYVRRRNKKLG
jgi:hypothetical protein